MFDWIIINRRDEESQLRKRGYTPGGGLDWGDLPFWEWWFQTGTWDEAELTDVLEKRFSGPSNANAGQHQATFERGNERGNFLVSKLSLDRKKPLTHWIGSLILGCGGRI